MRDELGKEFLRHMPDSFYFGSSGERFNQERERKLLAWAADLGKMTRQAERMRQASEREWMSRADAQSRAREMQDRIGVLLKTFSSALPLTVPGDSIESAMPSGEQDRNARRSKEA